MKDKHVRLVGLVVAAVLMAFVVSVYVRQGIPDPRPCRLDREAFESGRNYFHQDEFVAARIEFTRADQNRCDAQTQFYTAYSYYREGCGVFSHDDELLEQGLEAVDQAIAEASNGDFPVDDPGLDLETAEALKEEIEAGLRLSLDDLVPGGCR